MSFGVPCSCLWGVLAPSISSLFRFSACILPRLTIHDHPNRILCRKDHYSNAQRFDLSQTDKCTRSIQNDIRSTIADAPLVLQAEAPWPFKPLDSTSPTGVRARMTQTASTDVGKLALSGEEYNSVGLSSLLLGSNKTTTATGTLFAELGFIPKFENAGMSVPLRIDRGSLMTGSDVVVNVAGALPAGFSSEAVEVRFLSDATGFLMPNPYTDNEGAPRTMRPQRQALQIT